MIIDTFSYDAVDAAGLATTATVTITLLGSNDVPVAVSDMAATDQNSAVTVAVLDNDTDADVPDTLVVSMFDATSTQGGTITAAGNSLTYTPPLSARGLHAGETLIDSFQYNISDAANAGANATVTITLTGTRRSIDRELAAPMFLGD